ncbi:SDR family oxidoreductase [Achromobacter dolens]|jgi:UDP-glucose 4-epimerase|uniref:NAD-dependent epimerase/dehydratase family protein n=1 Tax=Achromobacter dolens TaxID=1287738 RepID=UPI0011A2F771|nr:SDR family oxidoreductase [Achromobacter dolens]MCZ8407325.1 SDR family oxidoreductase [Achromobacter dolens]
MKRILITGAHGFIGKHLAHELAAKGHAVCGLGHGTWPESGAARWGVSRWMNSDITLNALRLLQRDFGTPDVVFHLAGGSSVGAAVANPREDFFRTVTSTVELLEWLRLDAPACALVVISSAAVYGAGHEGLIDEAASLTPFSPYGYHKMLMEELCRSYAASYGQTVAVARLFSVYGPGLQKQLLWDLCSKLADGADAVQLGGTGEELRDWTSVRDVARALDHLMEAPAVNVPVYNLGTALATPVREIARRVITQWVRGGGQDASVSFSGRSRSGDPFSLVADGAKLTATGFKWQIDLEQGLAEYVDWYRSQTEARS